MKENISYHAPETNEQDVNATHKAFRTRLAPVCVALGISPDIDLFGDRHKTNEIINRLSFFSSKDYFFPLNPPVSSVATVDGAYIDRLLNDFGYLERYWQSGLAGVNGMLATLMDEIKDFGHTEDPAKGNIAHRINDLLASAIYLFPHVARTIEVMVAQDTVGELQTLRDLRFRRSAKTLTALSDTHFTLPLPYNTQTEKYTRQIHNQSDIFVGWVSTTKRSLPVLVLRHQTVGGSPTYVPLSLVSEIRFSSEYKKLTPPLIVHQSMIVRPFDKTNVVEHYLRFRHFANYRTKRQRKDFMEDPHTMTDDVWEETKQLLEPRSWEEQLWHQGYDIKTNRFILHHGFLVLRPEELASAQLFEFEEIPLLRSASDHLAQADLLNLVLSKVLKVPSYHHIDILRLLCAFPVVEWNYLWSRGSTSRKLNNK